MQQNMQPINYNKEKYHGIRIDKTTADKLKRLSKRSNLNMKDYMGSAIEYLYKSGVDVTVETKENIPDLIKNLDNRMIGFMKKREKDFFVPMLGKVDAMIKSHKDLRQVLDVLDPSSLVQDREGSSQEGLSDEVSELKEKLIKAEKKNEWIAKERDLYFSKLSFLMNHLKKGGTLSGGKFYLDVGEDSIDEIKELVKV